MPKKAGILFVVMGAVLMLSALLLFLHNGQEERRAGQEAELLLDDIRSAISGRAVTAPLDPQTESTPTGYTEPTETRPAGLPVVVINGYGYIGYLSIPDLELELPVMSDWDYDRLKISPCRHFGSTVTDDMVIAAHNYKTHFGTLSRLEIGAEVCFTDMDGIENRYTLAKLETLAPEAVDAVQNSGYDLVLYTCTPGAANRVVAFCNRATEGPNGEQRYEQAEKTWVHGGHSGGKILPNSK